jgi:hypothetical protein
LATTLVLLGASASAAAAGTGASSDDPTRVPTVSVPEPGGRIQALGITYDFPSVGYEVEEYFFEGTATGYAPVGALPRNGKWRAEESESAPYKTRMIVVKPADPDDFNGTVYVEWFNVTGGVDAGPTFLMAHNQMLRTGAAWVGVTSQAVGVHGGATTTVQSDAVDIPEGGLVNSDPARYGTLTHPGDLYSYDIFTQAGTAIRGQGEGIKPFAGYDVEQLYAMGESQSAGRLTTYINAVHPLAEAYDGYLIHSRGSTPAPFGEREPDVVDTTIPTGAQIRANVDVPVFTFQTEYDVHESGYADARQPDSKNFRLWEVAGTSHIDAYTGAGYSLTDLGDGSAEAKLLDPAQASSGLLNCAMPLNAGSQHAPLSAALAHLDAWARRGTPPPTFPRIQTSGTGESIEIVRDELGLATGGVRTPIVDVPLAVNVGDATNTPDFCRVFGHVQPLDAATLAELYPDGSTEYSKQFARAVDKAVKAGVWLKPEAKHFKAASEQITFG